MEEKLVSIALCTHNGEKHIRAQLESIVKQSHSNLEIVIVDDCSHDNTVKIIEEFAVNDKRVKLYTNPYIHGFNKNFEKAISLTNGDFVAISDQDDIWVLSKVSDLLNIIEDKWLVFSNSSFIKQGEVTSETLLNNFSINNITYKAFLFNNFVTGHTTLFKKEFLNYLLPIPDIGYYDWYMGFLAMYYNQITYCNKVLTNYRIHPDSVIQKREASLSEGNKSFKNFMLVSTQLKAFLSYNRLKELDKLFINDLTNSYEKKKCKFSFPLFKLILVEYNNLFPLKHRKGLSLVNFAFKYAKRIRIV